MQTTHKNLKNFVGLTNGLYFISSPYARDRYYRKDYKNGFSDTYITKSGIKHRRKYYIKCQNKIAELNLIKALIQLKEMFKDIDYDYKLKSVPEKYAWKVLEVVTSYVTEK